MICKSDISNIKEDIGEKIGQRIIVKGSLGRSKSFEKEATIEKAYPNIFVVKYRSPVFYCFFLCYVIVSSFNNIPNDRHKING